VFTREGQCDGTVIPDAGTTRFLPKAAFVTTVETTIYCAPESTGKGVGRRLYTSLFESLHGEDVHRLVAGFTMPNAASAALHQRLRFKPVGVFIQVGRKFARYWDACLDGMTPGRYWQA
jgi:phosphinothricin acetyltransferase